MNDQEIEQTEQVEQKQEVPNQEESQIEEESGESVDVILDRMAKGKKDEKPIPAKTEKKDLEKKQAETEETAVKPEKSSPSKPEVEVFEKRLADSQKWATELSRKLKTFEQKVKKAVDDGLLDDDDAKDLLNATQHEEKESLDNPFAKYIKMFDSEIEGIKKYGNEENLERKILSFNHLLRDSSPEELEQLMEELEGFEEDSIGLTKKILEIGKKHDEEVFGEFFESGNLRSLKSKYKKEIENKQKIIDKLEKQLQKYIKDSEDYTESRGYKLPTGSQSRDGKADDGDEKPVDAILQKYTRY